MSLLVIQVPPHPRPATARSGAHALQQPDQWWHTFSRDGLTAGTLALEPARALPRASQVVLALDAGDSSWHRVRVSHAAAARMQQALAAVMEDQLLADLDTVHLALAPDAVAGRDGWVLATNGAWLKAVLEPALTAAAAAWPDGTPPVPTLRYEAGRLSLGAAGWRAEERATFAAPLLAAGWQVTHAADELTIVYEARP